MLEFEQAQDFIAKMVISLPKPPIEKISLNKSLGKILASDLNAMMDFPLKDNSAMDGYAIRHIDLFNEKIPIQKSCYAGDTIGNLLPGYAIKLFTGSLLPDGADTIVIQENVYQENNWINIIQPTKFGENIRRQGEDIKKGSIISKIGTKLNASDIAFLASQGISNVSVYKSLKVGILTSGNELINPGQKCLEQEIYNSNSPMLEALSKMIGSNVIDVLHTSDNEDDLSQAFKKLLINCDVIISVGGISVGEKDLIKKVLQSLGGKIEFWKIKMKPGKPIALINVKNTPVLCLPGNPVSAYVTFITIGTLLIRGMQGRNNLFPPIIKLPLRIHKEFIDSRENFLRVKRVISNGFSELICYPKQDSSFISSIAWANGFARLPANTKINDHDLVDYYDLQHWTL
ncbi:MAG: molybdopterin molybdotransferase MoeA [Bordetella sp.]|nr:MAG: molybdopterin molybdotransferase MoeA [Bordetella sp.]